MASVVVAGCGGQRGGYTEQDASRGLDSVTAQSVPARRGIQALYFGNFSPCLASDLAQAMGSADPSTAIELAYDPDFTNSGNEWVNAKIFLDQLSTRKKVLTVHFGYQGMSSRYTPAAWGQGFYKGVFRDHYGDTTFVLSPGNEVSTFNSYATQMKALLDRLVTNWTSEHPRQAFPYGQVHVRCFGSRFATSFNGFTVENEYHIPMTDPSASLPANYTVYSNDGQTVYDSARGEARNLAYRSGRPVLSISTATFNSLGNGKSLLLWHPAFHMWAWDARGYYNYDLPKSEVSGAQRDRLLKVVRYFMNPNLR